MINFLQKVARKWQVVAYMALVFGSAAFLLATKVPPKYRSDVKILIVQKNIGAFSSFETVNYLSNVFVEVAYTESFLADVLLSPFEIGRKFPSDAKKRKEEWKKILKMGKIGETGIIEISVFDTSKKEAEKIAGAVGWNFLENAEKYYGNSGAIDVKIIDGPITSSSPAYPDVFLSALLGVLAGIFVSGIIIHFYDSFDLKVAPKSRKIGRSMIKSQLERQLRARKDKKALSYAQEKADFYPVENFEKRSFEDETSTELKQREKNQKKHDKFSISHGHEELIGSVLAPFGESQFEKNLEQAQQNAKFEKEKRRQVDEKIPDIGQKEQEREEDDKPEDKDRLKEEEVFGAKGNFLSRLYGKSIFADQKYSSQKEAVFEKDRQRQKARDLEFSQQERAEQVKKITPSKEEAEKTASLGERKASAPKNLPIFLENNEPERENSEGPLQNEKNESVPGEDTITIKENKEMSPESEKGEAQESFDEEKEPSEEEIKDRLNKLLKGEL